nr:unnamed protein product [Callosobruchus chinensis]
MNSRTKIILENANKLNGAVESLDSGNLSDYSGIDSNYVPGVTSDSDSSDAPDTVMFHSQEARTYPPIPDELENQMPRVQIRRKRKMIPKIKKGRKRERNTSEWIDVQAKKGLNLGIEHKNRKVHLIPAKQMKHPCKEKCRNKSREKINEENRKALFEEFWKIGDHTRQWDYMARYVKTLDMKQVKKKQTGIQNGISPENTCLVLTITI